MKLNEIDFDLLSDSNGIEDSVLLIWLNWLSVLRVSAQVCENGISNKNRIIEKKCFIKFSKFW